MKPKTVRSALVLLSLLLLTFVVSQVWTARAEEEAQAVSPEESVVVQPVQKTRYPHLGSREDKMAWVRAEMARLKAENEYDTAQIQLKEKELDKVRTEMKKIRILRSSLSGHMLDVVEQVTGQPQERP